VVETQKQQVIAMKKMSPWTIDAHRIDGEHEIDDFALIRNDSLDRFLELTKDKHRQVLVAGKGQGKTLALLYKSYLFHRKGYKCLPAGNSRLIERVPNFHLVSSDYYLLEKLCKKGNWALVWEISIAAAVLASRDEENRFERVFENLFVSANGNQIKPTSVSQYATWLVTTNKNLELARVALPAARTEMEKINEDYAIFIDNIDESLEDVCDPNQINDIAKGINPTDIWVNAQLGLIDAVDQYRKINKKIRIAATVRVEAFRKYPTERSANLSEFCEELTYSRTDLRAIFDLNVRLEENENLLKPNCDDMIERFFGMTTLKHDRVNINDSIPLEENVFDCLLRHTLGRPRDLMYIGQHIAERCPPASRKTDTVLREAIREGANTVYEKYKGECFPRWTKAYDMFLDYLPSNLLTKSQLNRIANAFAATYPATEHPACYFYERGLLGTILEGKQFFLPPNTNLSDDHRFPTEKYFFIHPCMTVAIKKNAISTRVCSVKFSDQMVCGNEMPVNGLLEQGLLSRRLSFALVESEFKFTLDGINIDLYKGHSQSRLMLAILLRATAKFQRTELSVVKDLDPIARSLAVELNREVLGIEPGSTAKASLLQLFMKSKINGGLPPIKHINDALNASPLCCNNGIYSPTGNSGSGRGPITMRITPEKADKIVYFDVCTHLDIEEICPI
jgi:hypothetical protein